MPMVLRIEMIIIAITFMIIVIKSVNRKKLWLQYSIIWIVISIGLTIIALFPKLVIWCSHLVKIKTPSNLIYLLAIISLSAITFSLTIIVSKQSEKIKHLVQIISIEDHIEKDGDIKNE